MGCGGSRFDSRRDFADDLYTIPLNFIGGEGAEDDGCPCDKVVFSFAKGEKEPKEVFDLEGFTAKSEETMKQVATDTYNAVKAQLDWLESEYKAPADNKVEYVGGKYPSEKAKEQLRNVLAALKEKTGFTFEESKADETKAEETKEEGMMEEKKEEEAMMEGGDDMMGAAESDLYAGDSEDYSGWANLPKLLLQQATVNPYFGDLVKADTIHFEFIAVKQGGFGFPKLPNPLGLLKKGAAPGALAGAASLISVCVNYCENNEKEVFFAGWAGKDDMVSLKEIANEKGKIMFPGVLSGWDSQEKALKSLDGFEGEGKQPVSKVVYKIKTKVHSAVVCREFVTRLRATVQNLEEKDGVTHIELAE